ncbi:hypothetical protein JAAARDRAFT_194353 [Jaapia argillacea MUCL 33604]|uniref:Uncharacterized protein n=1 Tax=Jaapia argillacea MUCL 33604 TaxID=933084 RepID=A0A067PTL2_9AGAM|nr:hypothetical protein JAAARDRAFT_194353 [Jaapia argillacea MUCL 33604]
MAPVDKAKAAGVSATSFLDLKAELAKHQDDFSKQKGSAKNAGVFSGGPKKPSVWARQNKGVKDRAVRDTIELEQVSRPTLESARAALEKKAKIYEQLRKGKTGGLSDKQYEGLLVDFDSKGSNDVYESDSDDVDESLVVPKAQEDDPIVEYEDEFGRLRTARKSEVPRHLAPPSPGAGLEIPEDDPDVIYNPINHFPTYEPTMDRVTQIQESLLEEDPNTHYDASSEVRAKGAGFYAFSKDEETRKQQMEELRMAREETEKVRKERGAMDVGVGEVEGMRGEGEDGGVGTSGSVGGASVKKSRAMEKRKRELEERRKAVEAKRRKVRGEPDNASQERSAISRSSSFTSAHLPVEMRAGDFTEPAFPPVQPPAQTSDPFVTLEAQSSAKGKRKLKGSNGSTNAADDFLAKLEHDMIRRS